MSLWNVIEGAAYLAWEDSRNMLLSRRTYEPINTLYTFTNKLEFLRRSEE